MRKEPYSLGSIVHVIKRGARGMPIVQNESDKWRFLKLLYFMNDFNRNKEHWEWELSNLGQGLHFKRPDHWPERKPMVNILSYNLLPNHFHLVLEEIVEGGISKFMQSLCGSMSVHYNNKCKEKGSLFQGPYKSKTVTTDYYLDLLNIYVNVKNTFELYPGGLKEAINNFDKAYEWASSYDFCSLGDYSGKRESSPILGKHEFFDHTPAEYKKLAREFMKAKLEKLNELEF